MSDEQQTADTEAVPPTSLDFSTFLLSLGTSALVQLGEAPDPSGEGPGPMDLPAARQTINLLGLLEDKTAGNLTPPEESLLRNLLRDLRLHFVACTSRANDAQSQGD